MSVSVRSFSGFSIWWNISYLLGFTQFIQYTRYNGYFSAKSTKSRFTNMCTLLNFRTHFTVWSTSYICIIILVSGSLRACLIVGFGLRPFWGSVLCVLFHKVLAWSKLHEWCTFEGKMTQKTQMWFSTIINIERLVMICTKSRKLYTTL